MCVFLIVYQLWASFQWSHLQDWVKGWVPVLVFSLGNRASSVDAWFSSAVEIDEVLSEASVNQLHVLVFNIILSFETVDRSILDCALGPLGLPLWFRKVYFAFHSQVLLRL